MPATKEKTKPLLTEEEWNARAEAHRRAVYDICGPYLANDRRNAGHPVYDFLFTYYSFRPSHLLRWSPGLDWVLQNGKECLDGWPYVVEESDGIPTSRLDPRQLSPSRVESFEWMLDMLRRSAARSPQFSCFGLHEWAMVYKAKEVRHSKLPLRMAPEELAEFVESQTLCCTHFDAFRFFTPEARPRNRHELDQDARVTLEQPGCLHANMDLYKWAGKVWPFVGSELLLETFRLAWRARELDMRASPYDLGALGFAPVEIETAAGREEYRNQQRAIAESASPLRERLIAAIEGVVEAARPGAPLNAPVLTA